LKSPANAKFRQVLQMTVREKPLSMMRDTRNGFVALVALMVQYLAANETGQTAGARFDPLLQLRASIPEISKCRQLIVVTTEDWNAISATDLLQIGASASSAYT
jgi:hypothetical protein